LVALPFGVELVADLGERANAHWLVVRSETELVVRRFRPIRSVAYAQYEADVCNRLHALGHPVPQVLDIAEFDDRVWMLMTRAMGEPGSYAADDELRRGRQLAELHAGLSQLGDLGQREDRVFADEVVNSPTLDYTLTY
jgi:aminoglycoside phosphotransferase (APT) family kinase protein